MDYNTTNDKEAYIAKVSYLDGSLIWENPFYLKGYQSFNVDILELSDGGIVTAGYNDYTNQAMLAKVGSNGNDIWFRQLYSPVKKFSNPYGISVTYDNGFIISGDEFGSDNTQDPWLLKLDSIGCPYPNCGPVVWLDDEYRENIHIYPNPGGELVLFSGEAPLCAMLRMRDMFGRVVLEAWADDDGYYSTSDLASGVYLWELFDGGDLGGCFSGGIGNSGIMLAKGKWVKDR